MDRHFGRSRWLALASLVGVAACGGSRSSGLDVVAAEHWADRHGDRRHGMRFGCDLTGVHVDAPDRRRG